LTRSRKEAAEMKTDGVLRRRPRPRIVELYDPLLQPACQGRGLGDPCEPLVGLAAMDDAVRCPDISVTCGETEGSSMSSPELPEMALWQLPQKYDKI
jgi:hypothetical protein